MAQKTGLSQLNICWPTVNIQRGGGVKHLKTTQSRSNSGIRHQWSPVQWCNGDSKSIDEILPHPLWIIEICSRVAAVACIFCLFFLTRKNSFKPQWWFQIYIYTSKLWTGNSGEKNPYVGTFITVMAATTNEMFQLVKGQTDLQYHFQITALYGEDILQQLAWSYPMNVSGPLM